MCDQRFDDGERHAGGRNPTLSQEIGSDPGTGCQRVVLASDGRSRDVGLDKHFIVEAGSSDGTASSNCIHSLITLKLKTYGWLLVFHSSQPRRHCRMTATSLNLTVEFT